MKYYGVRFGSGDPRLFSGLAPTFLYFVNMATNATIAPPSIAEMFATTGIYSFSFGTTTPMAFLIDAATTSPGAVGRYVIGQLDPNDRGNEYGDTLVAFGVSLSALGLTTLQGQIALGSTVVGIGNTAIAYGTSSYAAGLTTSANLVNQGSTLVGIGNTSIAYGGTNLAVANAIGTVLVNQGSSLVAIGNAAIAYGMTNVAIGTTIQASLNNQGTTLVAIGNTSIAIGTSINVGLTVTVAGIGSTASTFGDNSTDPVDLFGYLKRIQELLEGGNTYTKTSGAFSLYSRGSSVLLRNLTVTNSVSLVVKS